MLLSYLVQVELYYQHIQFPNLVKSSIFYEPVNSSVLVFNNVNLIDINNGSTQSFTSVGSSSYNQIIFNNLTANLEISQNGIYSIIDTSGNFVQSILSPLYGNMALSQYDGDVYLASQTTKQVVVIDSINGIIKYNTSFSNVCR
jgi:hypothetical protein